MNINPDINFNNVQHFKSIDSTNAEAHRYLENKNTQKPHHPNYHIKFNKQTEPKHNTI